MWLFVTLISYFIAAVNSLADKYILRAPVATPIVYTFYVGIFSIFSVVFIVLDVSWPGWGALMFDFLTGIVFLTALFFFFHALRSDEASRTISLVGAASPALIVFLSVLLGGRYLFPMEYQALGLLILGGILISMKTKKEERGFHVTWESVASAMVSALFFAFYFLLAEVAFSTQPFTPAFVATRVGSFIGAVALLSIPSIRRQIFSAGKDAGTSRTGALFVGNKVLAGIGFFLLNLGIAEAAIAGINIAFVNALEAVKYAFVFFLLLLSAHYTPHILDEHFSKKETIRKGIAIVAIATGTILLSIASVVYSL